MDGHLLQGSLKRTLNLRGVARRNSACRSSKHELQQNDDEEDTAVDVKEPLPLADGADAADDPAYEGDDPDDDEPDRWGLKERARIAACCAGIVSRCGIGQKDMGNIADSERERGVSNRSKRMTRPLSPALTRVPTAEHSRRARRRKAACKGIVTTNTTVGSVVCPGSGLQSHPTGSGVSSSRVSAHFWMQ